MIEIIKHSFNNDEFNSVNARELHKKLEVKDKFATWITRRINKYHFAENEDFFIVSENREVIRTNGTKGGTVAKEYFLTVDMAKELAMIENSPIGRKIRKYFIELEKEFYKLIQRESSKPVQTQTSHDFDTFDFAKETQINREILGFIELINSQSPINLFFLEKIYKHFQIKSPLELLQIDLNSYYFIPTELGKFLNKTAVEVNKILEAKGFQVKVNGIWQLTEIGKKYAIQLDNNYKTIKWKLESILKN